jgi:hypothetical protein
MAENFTARVIITGTKGNLGVVTGTVVVNVSGLCTVEQIVDAAMQWVDEGGFAWGPHSTLPGSAEVGTLDAISIGHSGNPSITLECD